MSYTPHWHSFWRDTPTPSIGIGYKPRYFDDVASGEHQLGWLEIHAENYMMAGGPIKAQLASLAERYPITCHGVGLSIGSAEGLDLQHLSRLKQLNDWLKPAVFSEHLAWSTHDTHYLNDLLPMPYNDEVLHTVSDHIKQVQDILGRAMLLENPSTYVAFDEHRMTEVEFIQRVIDNSGCGLLLDVNNVYVTATNQGLDCRDYIRALPLDSVGEIHLSGHAVDTDEEGNTLLIDSHDTKVDAAVWALYSFTLDQVGWRPTLIEWDQNLQAFSVMHDQAMEARNMMLQTDRARQPRALSA